MVQEPLHDADRPPQDTPAYRLWVGRRYFDIALPPDDGVNTMPDNVEPAAPSGRPHVPPAIGTRGFARLAARRIHQDLVKTGLTIGG